MARSITHRRRSTRPSRLSRHKVRRNTYEGDSAVLAALALVVQWKAPNIVVVALLIHIVGGDVFPAVLLASIVQYDKLSTALGRSSP